ncbi:hypothetical protein A0H81_05363 [Grifola frondosa]|uniref:Uncharacterized protein n=1 Tax=Grifola frondosa TaxID=5627 RepID=A0A1C7MCQ1_GRIFR|nr:hypothetical protein A0H81_05363 [Grifola frondosa]
MSGMMPMGGAGAQMNDFGGMGAAMGAGMGGGRGWEAGWVAEWAGAWVVEWELWAEWVAWVAWGGDGRYADGHGPDGNAEHGHAALHERARRDDAVRNGYDGGRTSDGEGTGGAMMNAGVGPARTPVRGQHGFHPYAR